MKRSKLIEDAITMSTSALLASLIASATVAGYPWHACAFFSVVGILSSLAILWPSSEW